ncbi:hypothetical protein ACFL0T_03555 [Candidatus Omnitrophota bacterium]
MEKKSKGISIIGYVLIGIPLFTAVTSIIKFLTSKDLTFYLSSSSNLAGLLMILQFAAGVGILYRKHWAFRLTLYIAALYIMLGIGLFSLILYGIFSTGGALSTAFILLTIFYVYFGIFVNIYFNKPEVKEQFK